MFGVILYIGACGIIAGAFTFLWVITRPIHTKDEMRSWRVFAALMALSLGTPYGAFEVMTRVAGKGLKAPIEDVMAQEGIRGRLAYYRVLFFDGKTAHVTAVAEEDSSWGGTDRPVFRMAFEKKGNAWTPVYVNMIYSDNRNLDGVVFPPYW
jgi:hypothetical protein